MYGFEWMCVYAVRSSILFILGNVRNKILDFEIWNEVEQKELIYLPIKQQTTMNMFDVFFKLS